MASADAECRHGQHSGDAFNGIKTEQYQIRDSSNLCVIYLICNKKLFAAKNSSPQISMSELD